MQPDWDVTVAALVLSTAMVLGVRGVVRFVHWAEVSTESPVRRGSDGVGFDPREVHERVEDVRRDFEGAIHGARVVSFHHEELLAATRRAIAGFAYFRSRRDAAQ